MVIFLLSSAMVSANDTHHHSVSNSGEELFWTGISEANEIIERGSYYLKKNITLSADLVIDETVNLCLNGHKIEVSELGGIKQIKISENGTLNICDCSGTDSGMITSARDTSTVHNEGVVNLYSGSLCRTVDDTSCIVKNETNSVMNMYGGKIYGTTMAVKTKGMFNVYAGSISGERGAFQIEGGKTSIAENAEIDCTGDGWATISLYGGTLNISGGTIKNSGGSTTIQLPYGESCMNISGGTISSTGKANCINAISADADICISGGTVKNNYGSVSYTDSYGHFYGWGIYANSFNSLTLFGNPYIDSVYLYDTKKITIPDSGLQNETPIGIFCRSYPMAFTNSTTADCSDNFSCKAPNSAYILYNNTENQVVFAMKTAIDGSISISGKSNINEVLTAVYIPSNENETYAYQWYCDDVAIENETNSTYTVKPEDINKKIKVVVSGTGFYRETKTAETTIVKTAVQYTPPTANKFEFSGTEQELVQAGECQGGVLKYSLSENGEYSEEIPKETNVGRYKVWYRAFGDAYHSDSAVGSVMARITAKDIANAEVVLGDKLIYTGNEQIQSIASVKIGELDVTYDIVSGEKATTYNPQGYVLTIEGNSNFTGIKEITYNIEKAIPIQNPEKLVTARVRRGQTLANATVTNGEFFAVDGTTVLEGTFAWVDDTETISEDTTKRMKFTPNDINYAEVEFDVAVDSYTSGGGGGSSAPTTYTVKFETNGGNEIDSVKVTKNKTAQEPTAPTKDGYTFDGWYTDKELTKAYDFDKKVTKAITLYAKWTENKVEDTDDKADDKTDTPVWENPFTDVKSDDWYYENVSYAVENGLFNGTTETTFAPNGIITRAMMVTVLYRAEGEPTVTGTATFEDVDSGAYYAKAVVWGQQNGIIKGYSETEFAPDQNITREQIAAIMHRYATFKGYDVSVGENTNILSYDDFDSISEYAIASMQYACGSGLMKGKTTSTLNPLDNATRAEIAAILHRFIEANK